MNRFLLCVFTVSLFVVSCKKKQIENEIPEYVTDQSQIPTLKSTVAAVGPNSESEELLKQWQEYQSLSELIVQYREISKSDALLNSAELEELARYMKDSIRIEKLDIPPIRMRLNVLHNEALRLADMATIPTITDEEVLDENNNLLSAYAALIIKINDMSRQEKINKELESFSEEEFVQKDSTSLDSLPKSKELLKQLN